MTDPEVDAANSTGEETPAQTAVFDRDYVESLRDEAAKYRIKAKRADDAMERLLAATVRDATRDILVDPTDLPINDGLYGEDGWPDQQAIVTAAQDLVVQKPHLAARTIRGDVGQGSRVVAHGVSLSALLRGAC